MPDITIDWLSFIQSKKVEIFYCDFKDVLMELCERFGLPFEQKFGSYNMFNSVYRTRAGISIYENVDCDSVNLIQISGVGCRFIDCYSDGGLLAFIKQVHKNECEITRLDLCADDKDKLLNLRLIEKKLNSDKWIGSARTHSAYGKKDKNGKYVNGVTYYIGSRKSNCMLRIYDKAAQTENNNHWVRVEIELHDKYAQDVVNMLVHQDFANISDLYCRLVYDRCCFLTYKDPHYNKELNRVSPWWRKFLDGCTMGLKLTKGDDDVTLDRLRKWVIGQCSNTVTALWQCYGDSIFDDILAHGHENMNKRQRQLVKEFEAEMLDREKEKCKEEFLEDLGFSRYAEVDEGRGQQIEYIHESELL